MPPCPFLPWLKSIACAALLLAGGSLPAAEKSPAPFNVLFIAVDDLNDWVGAFGGAPQKKSATPHLDRFAKSGSVVFQQANCAGPVCGPSRSALLSGFMPHRSGVYGNSQNMRGSALVQTHLTLPEFFSKHGYHTLSNGKIFHKHPGDEGHWAFDQWEDSAGGAGSRPDPARLTSRRQNLLNGKPIPRAEVKREGLKEGDADGTEFSWGPTKGPKEDSKDWKAAEWAAAALSKPAAKPFFMALGISKPHLPFYVPQEYFDRHPLDSITLPEFRLDDLTDIVDANGRVTEKPSADFQWVQQDPRLHQGAVQAYLAATSYADDCIGHVLAALEKSPARDNTIVVIWGDHGWHLGEKLRFRKATLWAESTRVPLIIRMPGMKTQQDSPRVVNLMDLFPTLIEACGLPAKPEIDGRSIVPLLRDPQTPWPHVSVTVMGRGNASVRDERWYFIRAKDGTEEFYDMARDPLQWTNLASAQDPEIRMQMKRLAASFPAAFAPDTPQNQGGKAEKQELAGKPDPTIRPARAAAKLK
jgi:arylsulfatase A-like enzyme